MSKTCVRCGEVLSVVRCSNCGSRYGYCDACDNVEAADAIVPMTEMGRRVAELEAEVESLRRAKNRTEGGASGL